MDIEVGDLCACEIHNVHINENDEINTHNRAFTAIKNHQ